MRPPYFLCLFFCLLANLIHAQSSITVQGTWEHGNESLTLYYLEDATTFKQTKLYSKVDSLNGKFNFVVPVNHPTKLQLLNSFFLAFPGDTVEILVAGTGRNTKLNFSGPKGADHSFFSKLQEVIGQYKVYNFSFDQNAPEQYKEEATAHFKSSLDFYRKHYSETVGVSNRGQLVKDLLTVSYYDILLHPLTASKITKHRLPENYFDGVDPSLLSKSELLPFREFVLLLSHFNDCFYSSPSPKGKHRDSIYIAENISSARANFKGEVRDNLLLFIYTGLAENGRSNNRKQVEELFAYLTQVFKSDPSRIEQVRESKHRFDIVNKPFPKEILAQRLKTPEGKYVSWEEVLSSNKVVYVDFWASWCGPCIAEMPNERQLISEFKEKGIEFVFISLDKDEMQWKAAMDKIKTEGNHYLIDGELKSPLVSYLSISGIPRYLIINKNTLVDRDAPRPGFILNNKSIFLSLLQ